jgi:hypothetical protein
VAEFLKSGTVFRLRDQARIDQLAEAVGKIVAMLGEPRDRLADCARGRGRRRAYEWVAPGPALVQRQRHRVGIRGRARRLALGLLGRHVRDCPDHLAGRGQAGGVDQRRGAEVHHLRPHRSGWDRTLADDHVLRLDVAVDDPVGVGVGERVAQVGADLGHVAIREPALRGQLVDGGPLHELADEEGVTISLPELVQGDDSRMTEAGGRLGLAQDAP